MQTSNYLLSKPIIVSTTITNITIGNWYLVDGKPTIVTPENIGYVLNTLCQPIQLTPEILLKMGFVNKETFVDDERYSFFYAGHDSKQDFVCKARWIYSLDTPCCELSYFTYGRLSCKILSIKLLYVHQLQDAMRVCNIDMVYANF